MLLPVSNVVSIIRHVLVLRSKMLGLVEHEVSRMRKQIEVTTDENQKCQQQLHC